MSIVCVSKPLNFRVPVPDIRDPERRGQIDEAVSVHVPDVRTRRTLPEDGRGLETRDILAFDGSQTPGQLLGAWSGYRGSKLRRKVAGHRHDAEL